jgi:hypothetical protein
MKTTKWVKTNLFAVAIGVVMAIGLGMLVSAQVRSGRAGNAVAGTGKGGELKAADYQMSGPYTHANLAVFLIHGPNTIVARNFLTLQEALAQKKVIVFEKKSVNELSIQNLSNEDIYVQAGDIVKGGQQDRMLSVDLIVPPHSGKIPIAAFCVESGRWNKRGNEQAGTFGSSSEVASTRELKLAAKLKGSQGEVWKNVAVAQDKLSQSVGVRVNSEQSESSLQLAVENPKVQQTADSYLKDLSQIVYTKRNVIGYVFAINGKVNSADVYASSVLFRKLWPKLLRANAIEAISELRSDQKFQPASVETARSFLADAEAPAPSEKDVSGQVKLVTREDKENVFFETRAAAPKAAGKDEWVHRNYIKKN